ncbi:MAG: relaxase domain-containing protein [Gammaproteobacteria bacterium]|nr:relaxase domain-containing protein [Gammaproteobacteria bacterium]
MLRINQKKDASSAKDYFKHELSQGDYYSEGQEVVGMWGGEAAKLLGLSGQVLQQDFGTGHFPVNSLTSKQPKK